MPDMKGGWLALGLVGFMLVGGIYSLIVDQAWLGGSIWTLTALILLPPVQDLLAKLGLKIPPPVSLSLFVLGFFGGLLALR